MEVFVNLTCINQTLNKIPMEEVFVNLTCINQTLNKIPMEELFVNLTCINQTLNKIPMEELFVNLTNIKKNIGQAILVGKCCHCRINRNTAVLIFLRFKNWYQIIYFEVAKMGWANFLICKKSP
jgi:hypothetical protein